MHDQSPPRTVERRYLQLPETLQGCASEIGLNEEFFVEYLTSPAIESELQHQMQRERSMDGYSYPSLRLVINNTVFSIAVDYLDHRTMLDEIKTIESVAPHT